MQMPNVAKFENILVHVLSGSLLSSFQWRQKLSGKYCIYCTVILLQFEKIILLKFVTIMWLEAVQHVRIYHSIPSANIMWETANALEQS